MTANAAKLADFCTANISSCLRAHGKRPASKTPPEKKIVSACKRAYVEQGSTRLGSSRPDQCECRHAREAPPSFLAARTCCASPEPQMNKRIAALLVTSAQY